MVKSKLEAQLAGAAKAAQSLNSEAQRFSGLKDAFTAAPAAGSVGIQQFLDQRQRQNDGAMGRGEGGGTGGSFSEIAASAQEISLMESLGESLEYIRKLMAAAAWAGIPQAMVLRAKKEERDALIAAWEASGSAGSSSSGGSKGYVETRTQYTDPLGNYNPLSRLPPGAPGHMTSLRPSSIAAPDPTSAIASGAKATVSALNSVVGELQRLNKSVGRKPTGVELRSGAMG